MGTEISLRDEKQKAKDLCVAIVNENYEKLMDMGFLDVSKYYKKDGSEIDDFKYKVDRDLRNKLAEMNPHVGSAYSLDVERGNLDKPCKLSIKKNMRTSYYSFDVYEGEHINANITVTDDARILGTITDKNGVTLDQFNGSLNNGNPFYEYADRQHRGEWGSSNSRVLQLAPSKERDYYFEKFCRDLEERDVNPKNYLIHLLERSGIMTQEEYLANGIAEQKMSVDNLYKESWKDYPISTDEIELLVNDQKELLQVELQIERDFGEFSTFTYLSGVRKSIILSAECIKEMITSNPENSYLYDNKRGDIYIEDGDKLCVVNISSMSSDVTVYKSGETLKIAGEDYSVEENGLQVHFMKIYGDDNFEFQGKSKVEAKTEIYVEPEPEVKKTRPLKPGR